MIPQITKALSNGFTSKQILDFLIKKFPKHSDKIKYALASGYTVDQILKFLSGGRKTVNKDFQPQTEYEQTKDIDIQRKEKANQQALAAAALAATPIASQAASYALSRAAPQVLHGLIPGSIPATQKTMLNPHIFPSPISPSESQLTSQKILEPQQPPISAANIPQQQPIAQPEGKINISELISKHGLKQHIDKLAEKYKDPKHIAGVLYNRFPKEMKEFQRESGKMMEDAIGDYLSQKMPEEKTEIVEKPQIPEEKSLEFKKNETVASPQGIGEVKEIRNDNALINVEGKLHKVNVDKLIQSPLPIKDIAELYEDLIQGIEKHTGKQVSRNVEWAGYDPKSNELAYKPHGSERLYHYDEISPEDVEILTSLLTKRKSTGENFIGAWEAGTESPIGAAMYQLIKKLQSERGGKGNEYKNRFETIYDALEPAKAALKEKHAERKKKAKKPRID